MSRNHTHLFPEDDVALARLCKALAHPARLQILRLLAERNSCVCGDLVDDMPLAQATVSQHLKELKDAGLVRGEIDGPRVCYCIDQEAWASATQMLAKLSLLQPSTCC